MILLCFELIADVHYMQCPFSTEPIGEGGDIIYLLSSHLNNYLNTYFESFTSCSLDVLYDLAEDTFQMYTNTNNPYSEDDSLLTNSQQVNNSLLGDYYASN